MEIFDAIEALATILGDFIYDKAFDKNKNLNMRLPYIIIYIFISLIIISLLIYLGIILIINNHQIFGISLFLIDVLFLIMLVLPIIKIHLK